MDLASLFMDVVPNAMREYRKEMRNSRSLHLSVPQFRILAHVWRKPSNNRMLAEELGVSVAAMSRMLDGLCKQGLIERLENSKDRRQVQVQLTAIGRKRFEQLRKEACDRLERRFQALNLGQQQSLNSGLKALSSAVQSMSDSPEA